MKKSKKRFASAVALTLLILGGGVFALPSQGDNSFSQGSMKDFQKNPFGFIDAQNLAVPGDFDYVDELNKEFTKTFDEPSGVDEDTVRQAIRAKEYSAWLEEIKGIKDLPSSAILSKEEFDILSKLKKE